MGRSLKYLFWAILRWLALFVFAVAYLFGAVIWDEEANELYIYNYNWPFALIDALVWRLIPVVVLVLFLGNEIRHFVKLSASPSEPAQSPLAEPDN